MTAQEIDIGGGRVVRVGTYTVDHGDDDVPELRAFLVPGWQSLPLLPFGPEAVDIPADAVPAILDALAAAVGGS